MPTEKFLVQADNRTIVTILILKVKSVCHTLFTIIYLGLLLENELKLFILLESTMILLIDWLILLVSRYQIFMLQFPLQFPAEV